MNYKNIFIAFLNQELLHNSNVFKENSFNSLLSILLNVKDDIFNNCFSNSLNEMIKIGVNQENLLKNIFEYEKVFFDIKKEKHRATRLFYLSFINNLKDSIKENSIFIKDKDECNIDYYFDNNNNLCQRQINNKEIETSIVRKIFNTLFYSKNDNDFNFHYEALKKEYTNNRDNINKLKNLYRYKENRFYFEKIEDVIHIDNHINENKLVILYYNRYFDKRHKAWNVLNHNDINKIEFNKNILLFSVSANSNNSAIVKCRNKLNLIILNIEKEIKDIESKLL